MVKKVIDDLGKYFALDDGTDRSKKKGPGQDDAFVLFIRSEASPAEASRPALHHRLAVDVRGANA